MTADRPRSRRHKGRGERVLVNRQRAVQVRQQPLSNFLRKACDMVLPSEAGVAVCLVTDAEIAILNRTYRGKHGPTDVLSFPAGAQKSGAFRIERASPKGGGFHLGDIAISPAAARRNAKSLGRGVQEELRILVLHGVLHLAGYDHETDQGEMERYELRLRRRLGIA
jgi:probable rRNA maturation factor